MAKRLDQGRNAAEKADIQRQCYELRLQGHTVRQVADVLGISIATVSRYCKAAAEAVVSPLVEEFRQYQDEQLDNLYNALLPQALGGSPRHVEQAIRILERRSKLHGLDAPVQVEQHVTQYTETDRKLEELAREIFVQKDAPVEQ